MTPIPATLSLQTTPSMTRSFPTTLFEATIPSPSLRPLSRILVGLSRIGDEICFEASPSKVTLSAMNLSKSAYGTISLDAKTFFTSFNCPDPTNHRDVVVRCKMQIRLLLSIFKTRNIETRENRDSSPESCQIKIIDNPQNGACRFIIRLLCKHGVVKTHQLTYSPANTLYAKFDRDQCNQHFVIQSKVAKEYLDHFQSKIEELDIYADDDDKLIWNGYTEGFVGDDNQLLKQPLQTQVSLSTGELDDFRFEEGVHIHIPLRDFKAGVYLAENLGVPIHVLYSKPGKPCVVSFGQEAQGIICEFIIAAAAEAGSMQSSPVQVRESTQTRQTSVHPEPDMMGDGNDAGVGWGMERDMTPARTTRPTDEEEDLYGEQMQMDEEEEVPPTQQERFQGIFDG